MAGAVVCAIIRYDGDTDDCRGASQGVAQYLCDEVDEHPAAYSMVCGSHEGFATWCRMLRRYGEARDHRLLAAPQGNIVRLEQASC